MLDYVTIMAKNSCGYNRHNMIHLNGLIPPKWVSLNDPQKIGSLFEMLGIKLCSEFQVLELRSVRAWKRSSGKPPPSAQAATAIQVMPFNYLKLSWIGNDTQKMEETKFTIGNLSLRFPPTFCLQHNKPIRRFRFVLWSALRKLCSTPILAPNSHSKITNEKIWCALRD